MHRVAPWVLLLLHDAHDRATRETVEKAAYLAINTHREIGIAECDEVLKAELTLKDRARSRRQAGLAQHCAPLQRRPLSSLRRDGRGIGWSGWTLAHQAPPVAAAHARFVELSGERKGERRGPRQRLVGKREGRERVEVELRENRRSSQSSLHSRAAQSPQRRVGRHRSTGEVAQRRRHRIGTTTPRRRLNCH
eukprot:scaffold91334_cov39-Tisochrysis_lutea.AAC.1